MLTIKDIAKIAGVTHSTVSRSLNDSPLVNKETKERIRRIAEELGYSPNVFARKLVTKRSHTLGVFFLSRDEISFMENFGTQFLDGIAKQSNAIGYDLLFFTMTADKANSKSYLRLCQEKHVEGVVFIGLNSEDPHVSEIPNADFPVCIIDYRIEGKNVGFVSTDNEAGVRLAMDYLYDQGHRRIAFLGGPEHAPVALERRRFYRDYMNERGLWLPELEFQGNFTKESGAERVPAILRIRPTALLAANDFMALGAMKSFKSRGFQVPEDLSIIGYDNALAAEYSDPGLTTVGQNALEMGSASVRFLFERINGKKPKKVLLIPPTLVIRESVKRIG